MLSTNIILAIVMVVGQFVYGPLGLTFQKQPASGLQKGISFTAWGSYVYQTPQADASLVNISQTGADWVSLIVTQYQPDIHSTQIQPERYTPSDASLEHAIQAAHRIGLKVLLKPHVDLSADPKHWRGQIGTNFTSAQWEEWFTSYRQFILHYARLAERSGVDEFCAGTELTATQSHAASWRKVIASVRQVYHGPVVYAANFGDEYFISWWDALDLIGVDAYYPLSLQRSPTIADMKTSWDLIGIYLETLAVRENRPILFTEIGYRSMRGAASWPGDYWTAGPADPQLQADAYQAAFESLFDKPWFAGMFWWDWGAGSQMGGVQDAGYTPQNKPALDVLTRWYTGAAGG